MKNKLTQKWLRGIHVIKIRLMLMMWRVTGLAFMAIPVVDKMRRDNKKNSDA